MNQLEDLYKKKPGPYFSWPNDGTESHYVYYSPQLKKFIDETYIAKEKIKETIQQSMRYTRDMDSTNHNNTLKALAEKLEIEL